MNTTSLSSRSARISTSRIAIKIVIMTIFSLMIFLGAETTTIHAGWPYSDRYEQWSENRDFPIGAWHSGENPIPTLTPSQRITRYMGAELNHFIAVDAFNNTGNLIESASVGLEFQLIATTGSSYQQNIIHAEAIGDGPTTISVFEEPVDADIPEVASRILWAQQLTQPGVHGADAPLIYANVSPLSINLNNFFSQTTNDIASYDYYTLLLDGSTLPNHFSVMESMRDAALQHNIPLWMAQQAYRRDFEPGGGDLYRLPSESDMRFQAFGFLALGGQGIHYFVYQFSSFPTAIIDFSINQPTAVYTSIQNMIPEIKALGQSLKRLKPVGDGEFLGQANTQFTNVTAFVSTSSRDLYNVEGLETGLVSFFEDESGEEYFMVVNLKHGANLDQNQADDVAILYFAPTVVEVQRLNRYTGLVETLTTTDNPSGGNRYLVVGLPGGTGDLFKVKTAAPFVMLPMNP